MKGQKLSVKCLFIQSRENGGGKGSITIMGESLLWKVWATFHFILLSNDKSMPTKLTILSELRYLSSFRFLSSVFYSKMVDDLWKLYNVWTLFIEIMYKNLINFGKSNCQKWILKWKWKIYWNKNCKNRRNTTITKFCISLNCQNLWKFKW